MIIVMMQSTAYASEPIFITISNTMNSVNFDGKWTSLEEWKSSSENMFAYDDGTKIYLRSAHQENFIYFFVDVLTDLNYDMGKDNATICLDSIDDKNHTSSTDYCFSITAGKNPITYNGDELIGTDTYAVIPNHNGFIGMSSMSDQNDRYSKTPHIGYEFRIPTDLVGRSNNYGMFLSVYDSNTQKTHTWPMDIETSNDIRVASGTKWGNIISPDKSLPELPYPIFLLMVLSIIPILRLVKWNGLYKLN